MPPINKPPIGLTDKEILCVIAYLQSLGGTPTVTLQTKHHYNSGAARRLRRLRPATAPRRRRRPAIEGDAAMKIPVLLAVVAVFAVLRFRRANLLTWAGASWVGIYVLLRFGFTAPIPASVVTLYMGIVSLATLAYVSSSEERREEVSRPLVRFMTEKRYTPLLIATIVAIPALAAANVYVQMNVPLQPPLFSRTVHPASPSEITVHDKKIDLDTGANPFRQLETSNPAEFRSHVENGRRVFYRNCVFCHGDSLAGNGMFVHGLDPIPTNFTDKGTIAMLRETYLFWRISKGGPGLPEEGGPWDTAMPAWEKFLKEDEIWDVDPLSLRSHRPEASRQGGGRREMTSWRIGPRSRRLMSRACLAVLIGWVCAAPASSVRAAGPDVGTEAQRESGKKLYLQNCSQCHGDKGDGEGYAATHLRPRPRNFTTGKFKVRTTPNGALPTHQDLVNIIRRGMPYTSMPAWPNLADQEVSDLAYFITTFSPEFSSADSVAGCGAAAARAEGDEGVNRAREEALRGERLRQVPRHARSGRRTVGADAGGRLGTPDTRGGSRAELDAARRFVPRGHLPDDEHRVQRHADAVLSRRADARTSDGRSRTSSTRSRGATGRAIPISSSPGTCRLRSTWQKARRALPPRLRPAFRSSGRSWSPDARSIRRRRTSPSRRFTTRTPSPSSCDGMT